MKKIFFTISLLLTLSIAYGSTIYHINGIYYTLNPDTALATVVAPPQGEKYSSFNIVIPETVTVDYVDYIVNVIGENAFSGASGVQQISLPSTIKQVMPNAFLHTGGIIGCQIYFACPPPGYYANSYTEHPLGQGIPFAFDALYEQQYLIRSTPNNLGTWIPEDEDDEDDGRRPKPTPKEKRGYAGRPYNKILTPLNALWYQTKHRTRIHVTHTEFFPTITSETYKRKDNEGKLSVVHNLTTVPQAAFAGKRELTKVWVSSAVKAILPAAFHGCTSLDSILMKGLDYSQKSIPSTNIESIGDSSFTGCTSLKTLPWATKVREIGEKCFKRCSSLTDVPFFNQVTYIPSEAFAGTALKSIEAQKPLYVANKAFQDCRSLETVKLDKALYIGEEAFVQCARLKSVNLPNATIIDDQAFYQCTALKTLTLPKADTIGKQAFFQCTALDILSLPNARTIGAYAFGECTSLRELSFSERLVLVPDGMCEYCTALTKIEATHIGNVGRRAFYGCKNLTQIDLSHATDIRSQAFAGCEKLNKLDFGPNLFTIGDSAFAGCIGIISAHCRSIVPPALGKQAFAGVNVGNIILSVPRGTVEMYRSSDWGKYPWKDIRADLDITITADLYCGDTIALTSSLTGFLATGQTLQLSSSDENIAIVDTNNVVRVKNTPGEVTITATIPNTIYAKTLRFRILPKPTPTPQPSYKVIARQNEGGVVTPKVTQAHQGEWVDVTVQPNAEYRLDTVAAQSDTVHWNRPVELYMNVQDYTQYRFSMPDSYVAVGALFSKPKTLFLNENQNHVADYTNYYGQIVNVTIGRTFSPGIIYTLALPFDLPTLEGTPLEGCIIAHAIYATRDDNNGLQVRFTTDPQGQDTCPAIHAGHPYLLWVNKTITQPTFEFVCISDITGQNDTISDMVVVHGLTSPQQVPGQDKNYLFFVGNKLYYPSHTGNIKAFRAFLQIINKQDYGINPSYWIMDNGRTWQGEGEDLDIPLEIDEGTDIDIVEAMTPMQYPCYKYLDNNQIVIFRNGKHYTVQGQLITINKQ